MSTEERIIQAYAQVARPILLRYLPRRSCIASAHIGLQALAELCVDVQPVPVYFCLRIPTLNVAYIAGISEEDKQRAIAECAGWTDLGTGHDWNGHLLLKYRNEFLIDPSFDQAFAALAEAGTPVSTKPLTLVLPLDGQSFPAGAQARFKGLLDPPEELAFEVQYIASDDNSYRDSQAWNDEAIPFIASHIVSAIRAILI